LQRPLINNDYIFPAIASTNRLKFGEPTTRSGIETLLDLVTEKSGVMGERNGKFTTHCFRRGGAQYRFMWADRKWSLKAVKWWGGWSSSERVSLPSISHRCHSLWYPRLGRSCATSLMSSQHTRKGSATSSLLTALPIATRLSWAPRAPQHWSAWQTSKPLEQAWSSSSVTSSLLRLVHSTKVCSAV
jgi:hypothetical protein